MKTLQEFQEGMQRCQNAMTADEYDQLINEFWEYYHLVYC